MEGAGRVGSSVTSPQGHAAHNLALEWKPASCLGSDIWQLFKSKKKSTALAAACWSDSRGWDSLSLESKEKISETSTEWEKQNKTKQNSLQFVQVSVKKKKK